VIQQEIARVGALALQSGFSTNDDIVLNHFLRHAEALVIDTGGVMSHGVIVARELGVTCVINYKHGTRDIPDGAQITVAGTSGRVIIHEPLAASERHGS